MHVSGLAVPVRILTMVGSGGSVLRSFFVVVVILLLGRLAVLFHRCFRLRSRLVLLVAGWLFLFLSHGMSPSTVVGPFIFLRELSRSILARCSGRGPSVAFLSQENLRQDRESLPSAATPIKAAPAEQKQQHDDQED